MKIENCKLKIAKQKGFTLIELLVAMFIFMMVMGGMVAVSVAGFRSYGKSKAIKTVTEDVGFAINSIAKDVRMGKIESVDNTGSPPSPVLIVTRNSTQIVVRYEVTSTKLSSCECASAACPAATRTHCSDIVDLSTSSMVFDTATSGFRNQRSWPVANPTVRGWAEINLNIESPGMDTDSIHVQTTVSSRDYGWETP